MEKPVIAVLAVQGAFIEHEHMLQHLGVVTHELRSPADVRIRPDGLVLPGGESTVQGKILRDTGMFGPIKNWIETGVPVLATCAGLILLAQRISNDKAVYFGTLPVTVRRNAYGRQLGSFIADAEVKGTGRMRLHFIRAPYIESVGKGVEILTEVDGKIAAVRYQNQYALAFHPEVGHDTRLHEQFLQKVLAVKED